MALFGQRSDIDTFKVFARELVNDIITQQIGYYQISLRDTESNIYGEATEKFFIGPVLLNCLIERGDYTSPVDDFGPDVNREVTFRFLRDDLIQANVVPQIGDILMYNELYFEVDNVNQNQLVVGKDAEYSYSTGLENFGDNYSIILTTHYTRGDKLGITQQR
jgi:hypothetical protein